MKDQNTDFELRGWFDDFVVAFIKNMILKMITLLENVSKTAEGFSNFFTMSSYH